jgi:hypothetical protein
MERIKAAPFSLQTQPVAAAQIVMQNTGTTEYSMPNAQRPTTNTQGAILVN